MYGRVLSSSPVLFPFNAMRGIDSAIRAILCPMVDPSIKGVMVRGPSGVGKTSLIRSLAEISPVDIIDVPIGITDDQLFGFMDTENAIKTGEIRIQEGLLHRADGKLLHVDCLNLQEVKAMRAMMKSIIRGDVVIEKDGVSGSYRCETSAIATVNITESMLDPRLSEMFDICVDMVGTRDPAERGRIDLDHFKFENDPSEFFGSLSTSSDILAERVSAARALLPEVTISDEMIRMIAGVCSEFGSKGFDSEFSTVKVSRVMAAMDGRIEVNNDDVKQALRLTLAHRRRRLIRKKKGEEMERVDFFGDSHIKRAIHDERKSNEPEEAIEANPELRPMDEENGHPAEDVFVVPKEFDKVVEEIGEEFKAVDLFYDLSHGPSEGVRKKSVAGEGREGKYIGSTIPIDKCNDLAFDATLRAAAPYQPVRHRSGPMVIESQDIREKIREQRITSTFIFMIDTSGSLIIRSRIKMVKNTILAILSDHYSRRDSVGVMTFNEEKIGMLQPPTRSVGGIYKLIDELPVGKKTPLSEALVYARNYMLTYVRKHPSEICHMILMTDGVANIPLDPDSDPFEEAISIAAEIRIPYTDWTVVDTSPPRKGYDHAVRLTEALKARYYRLEDLADDSSK